MISLNMLSEKAEVATDDYSQNISLILESRAGNADAETMLVERNSGLVNRIALRFRGRGIEFEDLVQMAQKEYALSSRNMRRLEELDKYLIEHFHITFGNRIMKQIKTYIPVYVSCGGEELAALDDILAKKVIRKLETQNPIYLRNTAEGLISHMEELFGSDGMPLCKEYIRRLERNA